MSIRPDPLERPSTENAVPSARVLLAEDDAEMRDLLRLALQTAGYEVQAFANGVELLAELERSRRAPGEPPYDVIVSDVWMPGITALEILGALRDSENSPPVILITAFGDPLLHERARELGAVAVLDKPFEMDGLISLVQTSVQAGDQPG